MMRAALVASLAWHDYRADARLSACAVLALVAVIAPLLVLFGLKFGLVGSLTQRLERDPAVREVTPMGGGRFTGAFIDALAQRPDVAFALPRTRQIAATADLSVPGRDRTVNVEMIPTGVGDPLLGNVRAPIDLDSVILSATAAEKLGATAGDWLEASFSRQVAGQLQAQHTRLHVTAVLAVRP
jgi:putative ABC transport system permease protein